MTAWNDYWRSPDDRCALSADADLALTAMDNVVAYDSGQGDPSVTGDLDLFAFLGIGPGFLRLLVRPEITSYDQLRGKTFAVDAPATGFSFVLRRLLQKHGIMPGEYSFVALGSTQKRFDGMVVGREIIRVALAAARRVHCLHRLQKARIGQ